MPDPNFDFLSQGYQSGLEDAEERIRALEAEKDSLRSQRADLDNTSAAEWGGTVGAALFPFLGAYGGGGGLGESLAYGAKSGINYWDTTVIPQDNERKKLFDEDIKNTDSRIDSEFSTAHAMSLAAAKEKGDYGMNFLKGEIPGTAPAELANQDKIDVAEATAHARIGTSSLDQPLTPQQMQFRQQLGQPIFDGMTQRDAQNYDRDRTNDRGDMDAQRRLGVAQQGELGGVPFDLAVIPGVQPPEDQSKRIELDKQYYRATRDISSFIQSMKQRVANGEDPIAVLGNDQALQNMLSNGVVGFARKVQETGASLTGTGRAGEVNQLAAYMPPTTADFDSYKNKVIQDVRGVDPVKFAEDLLSQIKITRLEMAKASGFYDPSKPDLYDDEFKGLVESRGGLFGGPDALTTMRNKFTQSNPVLSIGQPGVTAPVGPTAPATPTAPAGGDMVTITNSKGQTKQVPRSSLPAGY